MEQSAYRSARILIQGKEAGILRETEDGYSFSYLEDYLSGDAPLPVSLTLPLQSDPFESKTLFPFFDGLIPEGWLLDIVRTHWRIPEKDRFGVLINACRDCIGDVQIFKEEK